MAQEPIIIDKNDTTKALFDYNDPFSLVGLLYNNQSRAIDMEATGIDYKTRIKLEKKGWNQTFEKFWDEADLLYIFDEFGDPTYITLPDGSKEMACHPLDTTYYDLTDINRISITKDTVQNKLTGESYFGIDRLSFYKQFKIGGKHYKVFECSYTQLVELNGFKAIYKTNDEGYLSAHKKQLMKMYHNYKVDDYENKMPKDIGIRFFPPYYAGGRAIGNRRLHGGNYDGGEMYPREINTPTLIHGQSVKSWMKSLPFSAIINGSLPAQKSFKALFDSCYIHKESIYDYTDYGDEILIDIYNYYWIAIPEFEVYIQADFYSKDPLMYGSNSLNIEKFIYTVKKDGYPKPLVIFEYNLYKDSNRHRATNSSFGRVRETFKNEEYLLNFKMLPCFKLIRAIASAN